MEHPKIWFGRNCKAEGVSQKLMLNWLWLITFLIGSLGTINMAIGDGNSNCDIRKYNVSMAYLSQSDFV